MKRLFVVILAVFFGITFVSIVCAQSTPEKATKAATMHRYGGDVTAIDKAAKTLTVKGKKGDISFDLTGVKMMGEPKAGDRVMVQYTEKDGKMIADSVVAMKGPRKAEKKDIQSVPEK
jgi:hypothetical protein